MKACFICGLESEKFERYGKVKDNGVYVISSNDWFIVRYNCMEEKQGHIQILIKCFFYFNRGSGIM